MPVEVSCYNFLPVVTELECRLSALSGIKVVDFSRVLAGPFCTMLLGDFGAQIVKIEQPHLGDETRHWGPPWAGETSAYYLSVNRNKRSLTLNLKTAQGREIAAALIQQADVLVENFKVGQMAAFGLDYATLSAKNPRLVYCSITGYGQTGPYAQRLGYDYAIQAQSGLMSITGPADGEPHKVGVAIADVVTGLFAANAIQAALLHRAENSRGQYIDIALLDSQIAALVNIASNHLVSGQVSPRLGNAHPNIVPYQTFWAKDGVFVLAVGNDRQFGALCAALNQPELATDPRFSTNPARVYHREILIAHLAALFLTKPRDEWIALCLAHQIPVAPVNDIATALADDHIVARGLVQTVTLSDGTIFEMVGPAPKLSETNPAIVGPPPLLGEHTADILQEWLGYDEAHITHLYEQGVL